MFSFTLTPPTLTHSCRKSANKKKKSPFPKTPKRNFWGQTETAQLGRRALHLHGLHQHHHLLSTRAVQIHRCADLACFALQHLQKNFGLTGISILQEFDDDSCVISSHQEYVLLTERPGALRLLESSGDCGDWGGCGRLFS